MKIPKKKKVRKRNSYNKKKSRLSVRWIHSGLFFASYFCVFEDLHNKGKH